MTCANDNNHPDEHNQGGAARPRVSLEFLFQRVARARKRFDALEARLAPGQPPRLGPYEEPSAETLLVLQALLDDLDPRVAHLQDDLLAEIERNLVRRFIRIDDALDRLTGTLDGRRQRLNFRVISGGRK